MDRGGASGRTTTEFFAHTCQHTVAPVHKDFIVAGVEALNGGLQERALVFKTLSTAFAPMPPAPTSRTRDVRA